MNFGTNRPVSIETLSTYAQADRMGVGRLLARADRTRCYERVDFCDLGDLLGY